MPDRSPHVTRLIEALSARTHAEAQALTAGLRAQCWPGGGDRTEPTALDWLRRWGPRGLPPAPPACSCPAGRCAVCN